MTGAPKSSVATGFTLIELLIAMVIFAVLAVISYRSLASVFTTREALARETTTLRDLSLFINRLEGDFTALLNRPIRNADGNLEPALRISAATSNATEPIISFSRGGFVGAESTGAAPQRQGYRLSEGNIELLIASALDAAPRATSSAYVALRRVQRMQFRALDADGQWHTEWPRAVANGVRADIFPRAIELQLVDDSGRQLTRLFALTAMAQGATTP